MRILKRGLVALVVLTALIAAGSAHAGAARTEVVVELEAPPLARAVAQSRALLEAAKRSRLSLGTPTSASYVEGLDASQRALEARILRAVPSARVRWRYRIVLNALAVDLPRRAVARVSRLAGVARVFPAVRYAAQLDRSTPVVGAPALWGESFSTVGQGIKIGIIDQGIDHTHPFFNPLGYTMPAGFPRGNRAYTSAKVIVARAFPPPRTRYRRAALPFDPTPRFANHGTHVAGIAAGNRGVLALGRRLAGVAPGAYIGNYKALTVPAGSFANGNSPELAAAIEAAVRDRMDVVNLSLAQPEVEPARDLVVRALDAAVDAGVVVVVSAGNSFDLLGRGSVWSPGTAAKAITAAAATPSGVIADFSSSGPSPISLRFKPDVTAPGVGILSSVPARDGMWDAFDGTSMAAPHVAGAAALLLQRHPSWRPAQIKSALVLTGRPVREGNREVPTTREGGGMIDLAAADNPLVFAAPTSLSFGLLRPGAEASRTIALSDAGGGTGTWAVRVEPQSGDVQVSTVGSLTVPATLRVNARAPGGARQGEATGFVVLSRGDERRRIPYWLRVAAPALGRHPHRTLVRTGTYGGNTRGRRALIGSYRYPDAPSGVGVASVLAGPEQVFRLRLRRRVANFGVRIVSRRPGVGVEPRIVRAGDENRLAGDTVFPVNVNPYLPTYLQPVPASGVVLPATGAYDIVFDSRNRARAGGFRFRLWIHDTTPPSVRLRARSVRAGAALRLSVADRGSGVWPPSLTALVDGRRASVRYTGGRASVPVRGLARGVHRLVFSASDYQETRNHENVYRILPNTRTLRTTFRVR